MIGGLFQCYNSKRRIGETFFHLQNGVSLCLQACLKTTEVIEYLRDKKESLQKVINKLLQLLGSQSEFTPAPVLQVWFVLIEQIEDTIELLKTSAPQLISNSVQALSSGATTDSKKTFLAETTIFWKNRAEAARLLALLPKKLPGNICRTYGDEVLQYLDQCKHDRVCVSKV